MEVQEGKNQGTLVNWAKKAQMDVKTKLAEINVMRGMGLYGVRVVLRERVWARPARVQILAPPPGMPGKPLSLRGRI